MLQVPPTMPDLRYAGPWVGQQQQQQQGMLGLGYADD
jgi:hypothetical protein